MFLHIPIKYDYLLLNKVTLSIVIILLGWLYFATSGNRKCESICLEKGYASYRYKHPGKYNDAPGACYCITTEEAKIKNIISVGVQVPLE